MKFLIHSFISDKVYNESNPLLSSNISLYALGLYIIRISTVFNLSDVGFGFVEDVVLN